ncbi:hypothetical protein Cni_G10387 [Canna indica]|uniref:Reverse transcriptase domain-containing protein n=1 Tax=Canna indica TaxID=4628 RepID=A0AAQ3K609_9LILI|nr:hypothetical protein Cni_G10387 [Canna indica]
MTFIGARLPAELKTQLRTLLSNNADLFAWTSIDMPGINPKVIYHKLTIDRQVKTCGAKEEKARKRASTSV